MTDYCTAAEIKAAAGNITGTGGDAEFALLATLVSRVVDRFCNRPANGFVASGTDADKSYPGWGKQWVRIDECVSITTVAIKTSVSETTFTDLDASDWTQFRGDPEFPEYNITPYTGIMLVPGASYYYFTDGRYGGVTVNTVQVTADWGYASTVPPEIKRACIVEAARWYKMGQSAYADALANPTMGELAFVKQLSPVTQTILIHGRYVRPTRPGR